MSWCCAWEEEKKSGRPWLIWQSRELPVDSTTTACHHNSDNPTIQHYISLIQWTYLIHCVSYTHITLTCLSIFTKVICFDSYSVKKSKNNSLKSTRFQSPKMLGKCQVWHRVNGVNMALGSSQPPLASIPTHCLPNFLLNFSLMSTVKIN